MPMSVQSSAEVIDPSPAVPALSLAGIPPAFADPLPQASQSMPPSMMLVSPKNAFESSALVIEPSQFTSRSPAPLTTPCTVGDRPTEGSTAVVVSVGVTGRTSKHSPAVLSVLLGTPKLPDVTTPRQQYRPTDVRCVVGDVYGIGVFWSTLIVEEFTCTPPVLHVPLAIGPHR